MKRIPERRTTSKIKPIFDLFSRRNNAAAFDSNTESSSEVIPTFVDVVDGRERRIGVTKRYI
jgi:hypothetical protein